MGKGRGRPQKNQPDMQTYLRKPAGFTLVELAVVMVLIGIALTMGMKMLNATIDNAAFSETKMKQERIKTALIAYLRTNGKLPCPDNTAGVATGQESTPCATNQNDSYGVIPWQTLGIPRDAALDGWGNFFTYKVLNGIGSADEQNWTTKSASAAKAFSITELRNPTTGLTVKELNADATALDDVTTTGVLAIVSHGKNGFGAKTSKSATRIPTDDAGTDEKTNANNAETTFVVRPFTEDTAAFNGAYDDLVAFMSPQDLLQPLLNEGTLKACPAYCASVAGSVCSNSSETCSCPNGVGVVGTAGTCSGTCGTCTLPTPPCLTTVQIPIGLSPVTCPL